MSRFDDFAFVSTGDAEEDAKLAASIRRRLANDAEGLCANGCGPMEQQEPRGRDLPHLLLHPVPRDALGVSGA
jgi:hypothetical protein